MAKKMKSDEFSTTAWTSENYSARAKAEIERQAEGIADELVARKVGFDPITILTLIPVVVQLIQFLVTWFQKCREVDPVPPTPQEAVNRLYRNGRYHNRLLRKVIDKVEETAKKKRVRMTNRQVRETAIATLDHIREASSRVVGVCVGS